MTRHINTSQLKSKIRQAERKTKQAINCRPSNSEQVFSSDYSEPVLQCE